MNPNPKQRSRGRSNNGGNPNRPSHGGGHGGHVRNINVRSQVFDSNGPEGRIRGNAHQVMEKYLGLARDAASQGDRHAAENFYQHAEHYFRLINAYNQNNGQRRPQHLSTPAEDQAELPMDEDEGGDMAVCAAEDAAYAMAEASQGEMMPEPPPPQPVEAEPVPAAAAPVAGAPPPVGDPAPAGRGRRRRRPAPAASRAAETPADSEPVLL